MHKRCLYSSVTGGHFTAVFLGRSWCTASASLLVRVSDLIVDIFFCVGRLRRVLCACSEKGVCRQYGPSPLCMSCIYRLLASMVVLFRESSTLLCGLPCFLLVSKCVHLAMWLMSYEEGPHCLHTPFSEQAAVPRPPEEDGRLLQNCRGNICARKNVSRF